MQNTFRKDHHLARDAVKNTSQKEKDLRQILNNLPDGLFTMDKEGRVTYFNSAAERITGLSASDALGKHCRHILKQPPAKSIAPVITIIT